MSPTAWYELEAFLRARGSDVDVTFASIHGGHYFECTVNRTDSVQPAVTQVASSPFDAFVLARAEFEKAIPAGITRTGDGVTLKCQYCEQPARPGGTECEGHHRLMSYDPDAEIAANE